MKRPQELSSYSQGWKRSHKHKRLSSRQFRRWCDQQMRRDPDNVPTKYYYFGWVF